MCTQDHKQINLQACFLSNANTQPIYEKLPDMTIKPVTSLIKAVQEP